jgi:hypothetical protein
MKKILYALTLALLVTCPLAGFGQASQQDVDPACLPIDKVLDLKVFRPEVNINLPRFLLKDAATELNDTTSGPLGGKGPEFAELIKDVKSIRFVVIDANKTNRPALDEAIKTLRTHLEAKWTSVLSVPEDNVGIYAMGDPSGESVAGLAMLVYDNGDAVIGNIVGRVPIGKVIKLAAQMDKLPKDLLKKLQGMADKTSAQPASATGGEAKTSKPDEGADAPAKDSSK